MTTKTDPRPSAVRRVDCPRCGFSNRPDCLACERCDDVEVADLAQTVDCDECGTLLVLADMVQMGTTAWCASCAPVSMVFYVERGEKRIGPFARCVSAEHHRFHFGGTVIAEAIQ